MYIWGIMCQMRRKGFSLVEFSIALVIIGLVLAAISLARNLSDTSKLNSIVTDFENLKVNFKSFKQIYGQYPGDFNNASLIWASCNPNPSSCNGNGNGRVEFDSSNTPLLESRLIFRHLSLAGMLNETIPVVYTNTSAYNNTTTGSDWILGKMSFDAQSKLVVTSEFTASISTILSPDTFPWKVGTNTVLMSYWSAKPGSTTPLGTPLNASQAFYLDNKFDDGYISTAGNGGGATSGKIRAVLAIGASAACFNAGLYDLQSSAATTSNGCVVGYQLDD